MSYPNYENVYTKNIKIGDKLIELKVGKYSEQVSAAVLAKCGETVVHTTVALGDKVDWGYFPLHVEYVEKLYAGGIIKGSRWVKREGRPTDDAILKARVIDRSIRPLFPEGIKNQVQIINTVFSYDNENDADMLALVSTTAALAVSEIPFKGPIAGLRIGYSKEDQAFVINPTNTKREEIDMDLVVAGSDKAIVMVEAGANEVDENMVIEAFKQSQQVLGEVCKDIQSMVDEIGKKKIDLVEVNPNQALIDKIKDEIEKKYSKKVNKFVTRKANLEEVGSDQFVEDMIAEFEAMSTDEFEVTNKIVNKILNNLMEQEARRMILEDQVRPDGRKLDEIREIWSEIDIFPRTHGSAMFKRGATQACTITTLGNPSLGQHIEDMEGEEIRHYIHHYNMPPYAYGQAGRIGYPKRREVGHGALAERALYPMVPSQEDFPYTIRVVSEIMSSNGSTSQASICGSTLSLMAAGVPIKKPVAGIAMGLMSDGKQFLVLSDIQGLEDHVGDMDFKVAGTKDGITALQMDIKLTGIPFKVMKKALKQAKVGRLHILSKMLEVIDEPRKTVSELAPKIEQVMIPFDKIGELIGPGGKNIKAIIDKTGTEIFIEEGDEKKHGIVNISSTDQSKIDQAVKIVDDSMREIEVGNEFDGSVTRVENYGAFVEFLPGREGLVHVSQMSTDYVKDATNKFDVGDIVHVRVIEIKDDGKISLSLLTQEEQDAQKNRNKSRRSNNRSNNHRSNSSGNYKKKRSNSNRSRDFKKNKKKTFRSSLTDN